MRTQSTRAIVIIGGPTASGKSGLALAIARQFGNGVIINADALQLYRDLRVLSARPDEAEESLAPHRLYGVLDGAARGSVAAWLQDVHREITQALVTEQLPIVVGGSGMYLHALCNGLALLPEIDPAVRAEAVARHAALGGEAFRAELAKLDPLSADKLPPGDTQRLIRAYEVVRGTGRPLHAWQSESAWQPLPDWNLLPIVLEPERQALYDLCDRRFVDMMDKGALEEVEALLARQLDPTLPVMKAVGVPELQAYLEGQMLFSQAVQKAQQATRNYAKRQMTWFRNQLPGALRLILPAGGPDSATLQQVQQIVAAA